MHTFKSCKICVSHAVFENKSSDGTSTERQDFNFNIGSCTLKTLHPKKLSHNLTEVLTTPKNQFENFNYFSPLLSFAFRKSEFFKQSALMLYVILTCNFEIYDCVCDSMMIATSFMHKIIQGKKMTKY